jgi:hypothetical protein
VRTHVVAVISGPAHSYEEAYSSGGERAGTPKRVPVRVLADTCDLLKCCRHLKKRVGEEESECGLYLNMLAGTHALRARSLFLSLLSLSLCLCLSFSLSLSHSLFLSLSISLSSFSLSGTYAHTQYTHTGTYAHTIHTHRTHTHKHNTHTHTSDLPATQVDEKRNILYSASEDKSVKVWDLTTLKCIETLEGHDDGAVSLQVSLCVCVCMRARVRVCVCVCVCGPSNFEGHDDGAVSLQVTIIMRALGDEGGKFCVCVCVLCVCVRASE